MPSNKQKPAILVLDDDEHFRKLLSVVFSREGFEVLTARDGHDALNLLKANGSVAVITSDNKMPGMSGVEFFQQSKAVSPHSKRIMITSASSEELKPHLDCPGFLFGFHSKPARMSEILETVRLGINIYLRKIQMAG